MKIKLRWSKTDLEIVFEILIQNLFHLTMRQNSTLKNLINTSSILTLKRLNTRGLYRKSKITFMKHQEK